MSRLLRIIALDDCLADVRRLRSCLNRLDDLRVSLHHLMDAEDALVRLPLMRGDVLLIDEDLPRVTGVETIAALRSAGELRPIVATTRTDCGYLAADLMRAGADGNLAKQDLHAELVGRVLERALQTARSRQASDHLRRNAVRQLLSGHYSARSTN